MCEITELTGLWNTMVSMHPRILCRRCRRNVYMNNNWMFGRANCGAVLLTKIFQRAQSSRQAWFPAKRNARVARIASKQLAIKLYASILFVTSLKSFSDSATHLGLDISRPKTKLQNIGSGPKPPDQSKQWVDGSWVNGSNGSVFFGWVIFIMGRCTFIHDPPAYLPEACS